MSRTIKFRVWDTRKKIMTLVAVINFGDDGSAKTIIVQSAPKGIYDNGLVDGESGILMQFAGVLDKHGKKIYKDDILCLEASATGTVIEGRGGFLVAFDDGHRLSFEDVASEHIEIVGNTWENKEQQCTTN